MDRKERGGGMIHYHYSSRKYRQLVEWISQNDNPGDNEPIEAISGYLSVVMIAHCYKLKAIDVATDVMALRKEGQP